MMVIVWGETIYNPDSPQRAGLAIFRPSSFLELDQAERICLIMECGRKLHFDANVNGVGKPLAGDGKRPAAASRSTWNNDRHEDFRVDCI